MFFFYEYTVSDCKNCCHCCLATQLCLMTLQPRGLWAHQAPLPIGFRRQEYWSGLPFPSPGDLPGPEMEPESPTLAAAAAAAKSLQSCPTLGDPIDGSPPGSPVPGILQAKTLEWVAISFSNA